MIVHNSESLVFVDVKSKQHFDTILMESKQPIPNRGRICVPHVDFLTLQKNLPLRKGNLVPKSLNLVPNEQLRPEKSGRHSS